MSKRWWAFENQILSLVVALDQIPLHIERAVRLGLLEAQETRYEVIGEAGDLVLDVVGAIAPLPEGTRPW